MSDAGAQDILEVNGFPRLRSPHTEGSAGVEELGGDGPGWPSCPLPLVPGGEPPDGVIAFPIEINFGGEENDFAIRLDEFGVLACDTDSQEQAGRPDLDPAESVRVEPIQVEILANEVEAGIQVNRGVAIAAL